MINPIDIKVVLNYRSISFILNEEQQKRLTCDELILEAWKNGERFIIYLKGQDIGTANKDEVSAYDHATIYFGKYGEQTLYIALTDLGWRELSLIRDDKAKSFVRPGNIYKL